MLKAYKAEDFDLMHAHLLVSSGYTARRIKKKYGLKYVLSIRVTDLIGFIRIPFFKRIALKNAIEASGLIFLSRSHKDEFMKKYVPKRFRESLEGKSIVIGNPLENFWKENLASPRTEITKGRIKILLVGRINSVKNISIAAEAIKILREKGIEATLTVVGEVEDLEEEKKIQEYSFLTQLPFMGHEKLLEVYRKHDIFLLPSRIETFGRVYIEAMSQGLPILYSKGQGFDGVYPDGEVGYSVFSNDSNYIATKIEKIMDDYTRISNNCINNVSDFFEEQIIGKINDFYQNAIELN